MFDNTTRQQIIEALKIIRQQVCAYGSPHGRMCDCKFGLNKDNVAKDNMGIPQVTCGSEQTGCPELYSVIGIIENMSDAELERIRKRAKKNLEKIYRAAHRGE
jgi:hypothetical protein